MIKSFADKESERVFKGYYSRRLPSEIQRRARMRLDRIAAAVELTDFRLPPSHRLEKLTRDREGQYSIRINDQWRVCFRWSEGNTYEVEIADYH